MSSTAPAPQKPGRIAQIRNTYSMTRKVDSKVGWVSGGAFIGVLVIMVALGYLIGPLWFWILMGVPLAGLLATFLFARRVLGLYEPV